MLRFSMIQHVRFSNFCFFLLHCIECITHALFSGYQFKCLGGVKRNAVLPNSMLKTLDGFLYALSRNGHGWGDEGQMVHYKVLKLNTWQYCPVSLFLSTERLFIYKLFSNPQISNSLTLKICLQFSLKISRILIYFMLKFVII